MSGGGAGTVRMVYWSPTKKVAPALSCEETLVSGVMDGPVALMETARGVEDLE